MPLLRPSPRVLRSTPSKTTKTQPSTARSFSQSTTRRAAAHGDHFDPPTGWLWGKPPGMSKREGWENIMFYGVAGTLGLTCVAYAYKPDTSIQTWALEEARRRLEAEGILSDPETKN